MKIALCISGQMRTFERAYPSIKRHILDPLSPDVFIHTWSDIGAPIQARQMIPAPLKRLQKYLPPLEKFMIRFVRAYEGMAADYPPDDHVCQKRLEELFSPKDCVIEEFPENGLWSLNGVSVPENLLQRIKDLDKKEGPSMVKNRAVVGGLPMFYKMHACQKMCRAYAENQKLDYDVIIRLRPDLNITATPPLSPAAKEDEVHISRMTAPHTFKAGHISDQMAWGRPDAMDFYCAPWETLETLYEEVAKDDSFKLFGGEKMEGYHFSKQDKVSVVPHSVHDAILRPALNPGRTKKALKQALGF